MIQAEELEYYFELIKSNVLQQVLYGCNKARILICKLQEQLKELITDDMFLTLYHLIKTKNNTQILYETVWSLITIIYYDPRPHFIKSLTSNEIILNFFIPYLQRYTNGGYEDLINNIILLIGNLMYTRNDITILMRDTGVIKIICNCQLDDKSDRLSHHTLWTLCQAFVNPKLGFDMDILKKGVECFGYYISKYHDKKVLVNAFKGLNYLLERDDFSENAGYIVIKYNIAKIVYEYDLFYMKDVIPNALETIILTFRIEDCSRKLSEIELYGFLYMLYYHKDYTQMRSTVLRCLADFFQAVDYWKLTQLEEIKLRQNLIDNLTVFPDDVAEQALKVLIEISNKLNEITFVDSLMQQIMELLEKKDKKIEIYSSALDLIHIFYCRNSDFINKVGLYKEGRLKEIMEGHINGMNEIISGKASTLLQCLFPSN